MADELTEREERVRARARHLWEQAGRPAGRDDDLWHEAELQIELEERDQRPDPPRPRGGGRP